MKLLITGITGMIGSHIAIEARKRGYETCGIARSSAASRLAATEEKGIIRCDILDYPALYKIFNTIKPDIVVHMAAQAFNGTSWEMEDTTHQTNYEGTLHVLRAARETVPTAKILLACSSAEYGKVTKKDCPLKEDRLLKPITPYGVSKVVTECLGYQYYENYGMQIYLPRLFIHLGTGHPPATAVQNFARQVALIKKGKLEPILRVGNVDSWRDFVDVRDGVQAMFLLLEKGKPGDPTNICSGSVYKISDILDMLIKIAGIKVKIEYDKMLARPSDEPFLLGDNTKITKLGWKQQYSIQQTLSSIYLDWLARIDKEES